MVLNQLSVPTHPDDRINSWAGGRRAAGFFAIDPDCQELDVAKGKNRKGYRK